MSWDLGDPVEAVGVARIALESIDEDAVDVDTFSRLTTALEQLDNILLEATTKGLVELGQKRQREDVVDLADEFGEAECTGSGPSDPIESIRDALARAKRADQPERRHALKTALGETARLQAKDHPAARELELRIIDAIVGSDEEAAYFINQAGQELERVEKSTAEGHHV